jgi:hypothetical protein
MSVDKKVKYDVQGGVKNYLGKQKEVKAPLKWQSSPDHPTTELAYITQAEKDLLVKQDLHGSLKGGVNRGPSGIMSLNGWGSKDSAGNEVGMSGAATSDAETGRNTSNTMAEGASYKDVQDYQAGAVAAGAGQRVNPGFFDSRNTVSPEVLARAKAFAPDAYSKGRSSGFMDFISGGGIMGGLIRGLGQTLGLGKTYDQPTYDMSGYNSLGLGGTGQEGFGVPTQAGDYDVLGNKIDEITGEITSPSGASLGFLEGYPGQKKGIETIVPVTGGSDDYTKLVQQYLPVSTMPEDEELLGGFKSRFLQNRTPEERKAIEKMINEKFKYDYNRIGLGDMDGS